MKAGICFLSYGPTGARIDHRKDSSEYKVVHSHRVFRKALFIKMTTDAGASSKPWSYRR